MRKDVFLKACKGEETPYTPVWFMRQAGRYLPEYMKIRRQVSSFLELCKTPSLAAKVTIQPLKRLNVDAAILFSDILIPVEAMGVKVEFIENEGPKLSYQINSFKDIEALKIPNPEHSLDFVLETIELVKNEIKESFALIGFSGAPFTLASYILEGGGSRNYIKTKSFMYQYPEFFHSLMEKITQTVIAYLEAQIKAGVDAVQLFDSWVGVLSPYDFEKYVLPYTEKIIKKIKQKGTVVILFGTDIATLLPQIANIGADVISIDWRIELKDAIEVLDKKASIQGNLDPCALFMPKQMLKERVLDILRQGKKARGHIFNLGHGILPQTDPEVVKFVVDIVHNF